MLRTFSINLSTAGGGAWGTLSPGIPKSSGSLRGHVVAVGCPPLAAARLLPAAACRCTIRVQLPLPQGFKCFTSQHTTVFFLFLGGMLSRGEVSCILGLPAGVGCLACLLPALLDQVTTWWERTPGGSGKRVKTTRGCLCSASSTS